MAAGKPGQAIVNVTLSLRFSGPGSSHAILVVQSDEQDKRTDRIIQARERNRPR